jgi:hypothetical protein
MQSVELLYANSYKGQIILIDTDCMTQEFQFMHFGQVLTGWGEIFKVEKGTVKAKFLGSSCYTKFKEYFNNLSL